MCILQAKDKGIPRREVYMAQHVRGCGFFLLSPSRARAPLKGCNSGQWKATGLMEHSSPMKRVLLETTGTRPDQSASADI